jgi:cytoskeletal protein CcmA (bactofilin family)
MVSADKGVEGGMAYRSSESGMFATSSMMTTAPDEGGEGFSVIDRHSNFDGAFIAKRDLRIEGEVRGTIECSGTLFIAQGATVNAGVEAENITVAGDFTGEVNCRGRLQVMPSGRLRGKVTTKTLVINEGAFYEGEMEMAPVEQRVSSGVTPRPLPASQPARQQPSAPPASPPQVTSQGMQHDPASRTFIRRFGGPETAWDAGDGEGEHDTSAAPELNPGSEQS